MKNPFKFFSTRLQFYKRKPFQFFSEKKRPWNLVSKIHSRTDTLEIIFEKSHPSMQILKIVWATPQLVPNLTPIRKLLCTFLYLCCCYPQPPLSIYLKLKIIKKPKMDSLFFSLHFTSLSQSKKVLKAIDLLPPWLSRKSLLNSARARLARGL